MAIDFVIGALLLISALVNALALGAFWVTPGLRTTANRFVINLLIVNIVGCTVLTPSLFSCAQGTTTICEKTQYSTRIERIISTNNNINNNNNNNNNNNSSFTTESVNIVTDEWVNQSDIHCENQTKNCRIDKRDVFLIREINEEEEDIIYIDKSRCWGFDFTTALSAFSVLLIVGDTWCAITDPLRYHTRISELKAWILIVAIWFLSIIFGIASAFRHEISALPHDTGSGAGGGVGGVGITDLNSSLIDQDGVDLPPDELYDLLFSCIYFIVIILLPICLVCIMYWKIFTEARQNGLRMRQNGSSPLLQSALNLAAASAAAAAHCPAPQPQINGGLTMKIDKHLSNCNNRDSVKPLLTPTHPRRYLDIPKSHSKDKNHNIVVTLAATNEQTMRRNLSARHLMVVEQTEPKCPPVRQVHSSPNLHKSAEVAMHTSPIAPVFHPSVHIPPKALSYMTSIRHRLSNASSIFKYREESRAARISILVVIMFLISYFPYGLLVLFQGRLVFLTNSSLFAVSFLLIANISSPFLFAYRNKRVRRGVLRLFGIDPKTNVRLQKQRITLRRNKSQTTIQINRKLSKASNYSVNSSKYLTPHATPCRLSLTNHDRCPKHFPITTNANDCDCKIAKLNVKFSLFKRVRETSLKLGCGADACATDSSYHEPTEV